MRASLLALLLFSACTPASERAEAPQNAPAHPGVVGADATPREALSAATLSAAALSAEALAGAAYGALVYVPAYSHVYAGDRQQTVDLATTLSIRNTDARDSVRVASVSYVSSRGEMIRSYLDAPRVLGPYATADFVVNQSDRTGGSGASFVVAWTAETRVSAPVVEAVMINTSGQQGISFVTEGRVVAQAGAAR